MLFCKHKWKVVSDKVLPAPIQRLIAAGMIELTAAPNNLFHETSVTILVCGECGETKKLVTRGDEG